MKPADIKSEAFRAAALRSERTRILATLAVFVVVLLLVALREFFATTGAQTQLLVRASVFLVIVLAYEAAILFLVHKHVSRNKELPSWAALLSAQIKHFPQSELEVASRWISAE